MVSGDRNGYFNVFIRHDDTLTAYYQYRLMDSTILNVGSNSQPTVVDWNGDGKKDLLLGTETGYIRFYANQTSDTWPMFQTFEYVQAAGSPIYLYRCNPYVFDLDGDSVHDLICGANDGYVRFYRNIGTNANPILTAEESLKTPDETPIQPPPPYPYGSRCGFGDWNNDGLPDFLLSGYDGTVVWYQGQPNVGIEAPNIPTGNRPLLTVYPVPGGPPVVIRTSRPSPVLISDALGRPVRHFAPQGDLTWNGTDDMGKRLSPGVYFCRIDNPAGDCSARIVLTH